MQIKLVGILNVTSDSFSDGGLYLDPAKALAHAERLLKDGAMIIDVGAQASGPTSKAISAEEEIRHLRPILKTLVKMAPISVDTYRHEVAAFALGEGACMINDITAGSDGDLLRVVAKNNAHVVLMHSVQSRPHNFASLREQLDLNNPIPQIVRFLTNRITNALNSGVRSDNIIIDPGMGAFIGPDPELSWSALNNFSELEKLGHPLMLAVSRKGFLKTEFEQDASDRDLASAVISLKVSQQLGSDRTLYIRAHNPKLHRQALHLSGKLRFDWRR